MSGRSPPFEITPAPSRWGAGTTAFGWGLLVCAAVGQAVDLNVLWPLLACPVLLMTLRYAPETQSQFTFDGPVIRARTSEGERVGNWSKGHVSPLAIEVPVRWHRGGRGRVVLWRDAVSEADFRRVARRVRTDPLIPTSSPAAARRGAETPRARGAHVEPDR